MLGNVATTAAGVVAGAFLFQGIQGLMGHHGAAQGDAAKAGDTSASSVPPPSLPPQQMAAADQAPEDVDAAIDDAYADSGDAGDTGDSA